MSNSQKLLLIYIFQIIPLLINPPEPLKSGWAFVAIMVLIFLGLGFGLWRGHNWVLSLSLTMQGFNVIIRLLMFYPKAILVLSDGSKVFDVSHITRSVVSIALSLFFLLHLDRPDVSSAIVA